MTSSIDQSKAVILTSVAVGIVVSTVWTVFTITFETLHVWEVCFVGAESILVNWVTVHFESHDLVCVRREVKGFLDLFYCVQQIMIKFDHIFLLNLKFSQLRALRVDPCYYYKQLETLSYLIFSWTEDFHCKLYLFWTLFPRNN